MQALKLISYALILLPNPCSYFRKIKN